MTVPKSRYNSGCLFCPLLGDRGLVNHHLNKFVPLLASKLKSIPKVAVDDLHPVGIVTAARYDKQSSGTRSRIAEEEWGRPGLEEWVVLVEFGKRAVVPLVMDDALRGHRSRTKIPKAWWENKVTEAVQRNSSGDFDLDSFICDALDEAYGIWYPGQEYIVFQGNNSQIGGYIVPSPAINPLAFALGTPKRSSADISRSMAAIVMDPEDDQKPQQHEEPGPRKREGKHQRDWEQSCGEKKPERKRNLATEADKTLG